MNVSNINPETGDTIHAIAYAVFYNGATKDENESNRQGRPIYRDVEMIHIRWQGDAKKELHAPANDQGDRWVKNREDNTRYFPKWKDHPDFRPAYEAFKKNQAYAINGTPIEEAPFLSVGQRMELKAINIVTVEGLASLPAGTKFGSSLADLRRQAQAYLDRAKGAAVDAQYAAREKEMQDEISTLRQQMDALLAGGAKAVEKPAKAALEVSAPSPFDAWSDEELRDFITDADKKAPHNRCSRATLIRMATEANDRLRRESEGVPAEAAA